MRRFEKVLRRAVEVDKIKLGKNQLQAGYKLHKLGTCIGNYSTSDNAKRQGKAIVLLSRALTIYEAMGRERNISLHVAYSLHDLGVCTRRTGRLDEAEPLLRRALAIKEAILGESDVSVCRTLHQLALCLRNMQLNKEADSLSLRALDVEGAKFGKNNAQVALRLHDISEYFVGELWCRDEAEVLLRRTLAMEEEVFGKGNEQSGYILYHLGVSIIGTPRHDEAVVLLKSALEIFETQTKERFPWLRLVGREILSTRTQLVRASGEVHCF